MREAFSAHGLEPELGHEVDLCYLRQILDFDIRVPARALAADDVAAAVATFDERYAAIYGEGAAAPDAGYDLKAYRAVGRGRVAAPDAITGDGRCARRGRHRAPGCAARTRPPRSLEPLAVYAGGALAPGARLSGPALVEYDDTTILVPAGWAASVDARSSLILEAA